MNCQTANLNNEAIVPQNAFHKQYFFLIPALLVLSVLACRQNVPAQTAEPADPTTQPIPDAGQTIEGQIISGGTTRTYFLHIPVNAQRGRGAPLILNFHGLTSNGGEQELVSGMSSAADGLGYFVVYPNGLEKHWNTFPNREGEADMQFIRDLIHILSASYPIDPSRIYATGISNGGGMANRLACDVSDVIAAIAPVAGAYNAWKDCNPSRPIPVLAFHGLEDEIAPYEGVGHGNVEPPIRDWASAWANRNGCDTEPSIASQTPSITVEQWSNCKSNADVILYTLSGHGHSWPGSAFMPAAITTREINATDLIMQFFQAHLLTK